MVLGSIVSASCLLAGIAGYLLFIPHSRVGSYSQFLPHARVASYSLFVPHSRAGFFSLDSSLMCMLHSKAGLSY